MVGLEVFCFLFDEERLFLYCFAEYYLEKSFDGLTLLDEVDYFCEVALGKTGRTMFGEPGKKVFQSLILDQMVLEKPDIILMKRNGSCQQKQVIHYLAFSVLDAGRLDKSFEQLKRVSLQHVGRRRTVKGLHVISGHEHLQHEQGTKRFARATRPINQHQIVRLHDRQLFEQPLLRV